MAPSGWYEGSNERPGASRNRHPRRHFDNSRQVIGLGAMPYICHETAWLWLVKISGEMHDICWLVDREGEVNVVMIYRRCALSD